MGLSQVRRIAWSAVTVPIAVLAHEIGHVAAYFALGIPGPTLHYASSGFTSEPVFWDLLRSGDRVGAQHLAGIPAAGVSAAAGIFVTWAMMIAAWRWAARTGTIDLPFAVALASMLRFIPIAILVVLGRAQHTDEAHVALTLGAPVFGGVFTGVGLLLGLFTTWRILGDAPAGVRLSVALRMVSGVAVGTILYMGVLGPAVLP